VLYAKGSYEVSNSSNYKEAINDNNKNLITFWKVAREQPEELERWIDLTLYSQEEYRRSTAIYDASQNHSELEVAWAVFIQCNMSFSNKINAGWGVSLNSRNQAASWGQRKNRLPECFERLKKVHIGCEDALDFIQRWDGVNTLHYIDPPYPGTNQGHYNGYSIDNYKALCDLLDSSKGSYILSNYDQEYFPKSAQKCIEIEATMSAAGGKAAINCDTKRIEKLWICNRSLTQRNAEISKNKQFSLF
jgi:DNA adenine methylase